MNIRFFKLFGFTIVLLFFCAACNPHDKHLFILAGQSNMSLLDPSLSFTPTIEAAFGKEKVVVVKDAFSGQPIRRWYKDWKAPVGIDFQANPDLYDSLLMKLDAAISKEKLSSVTFIWMQGERDAKEELGSIYEESLLGLYKQLSEDLEQKNINFIIGRISDFDMQNKRYPHWTMIRDIQVKVAESNPNFVWINTDDLNDGIVRAGKTIENDLHMSEEGFIIMGQRFAEQAIYLITQKNSSQKK